MKYRNPLKGMASVMALALGLSPILFLSNNVKADVTHYNIWVGSSEVTSENMNDVLKDDFINKGSVSYDPETNTLYLEDLKITNGSAQDNPFGSGTRTVGIYSYGDIEISGTADISGVDAGIDGSSVKIKDGSSIDISAKDFGIDASTTTINDSRVVIDLDNEEKGIGIKSNFDTRITNSNVEISGCFRGINSSNLYCESDNDVSISSVGTCFYTLCNTHIGGGVYDLKQTGARTEETVKNKYCGIYTMYLTLDDATSIMFIDAQVVGIFAEHSLTLRDCVANIKAGMMAIASDYQVEIRDKAFVYAEADDFAICAATSLYAPEKITWPENGRVILGNDENYGIFVTGDGTTPAKKVALLPCDLSNAPEIPATATSEGRKTFYFADYSDKELDEEFWFADEYGFEFIADHSSLVIPKLSFELPDVKGMKSADAKKVIEEFLTEKGLGDITINVGYVHNTDPDKNDLVANFEIYKNPSVTDKVDCDTDYIALYVYEGYNPPASPSPTAVAQPTSVQPTPTTAAQPTSVQPTPTTVAQPTTVQPTVTVTPTATAQPTTAQPTVTPTTGAEPTTPAQPTTVEPTTEPVDKIRDFVDRIYKYVLDREPEEEGAAFWTNELATQARTGAEVAQGFIFSDEFVNKNLSDKDFVTVLYKTFFGRDPESDGLNYWVSELETKSKTREEVANGFIYSPEWAATCSDYGIKSGAVTPADLVNAFVERMYTTALGRESDQEGLAYWSQQLIDKLVTGEQVGAFFFISDEMTSYNLTDEEFVTRLYKTFMDREADKDGQEYWLGAMKEGRGRLEIVLGFTRSPEFIAKCEEAQIIPFV